MLKVSKVQEILNEAKELKSVEAKKALINSVIDKLQKVYDIFVQINILSKRENVVSRVMSMYQQGRFDEVIDGLSSICEDYSDSQIMDKIFYSNKGEWYAYNGIRFLIKDGILIIAKDNPGFSTQNKLKDYMIIEYNPQEGLLIVKEIKQFIQSTVKDDNMTNSLTDTVTSAIISQLLRKCID